MDKQYWTDFYKDFNITQPSLFAKFVKKQIDVYAKYSDFTLVELGCGNGRDSYFLSQSCKLVRAYDLAIQKFQSVKYNNSHEIRFIPGDFTKDIAYLQGVDVIYSRFSWHSITYKQEESLLESISTINADYIFIECRTIYDNKYGVGEQVGKHSFLQDNHFRRFIDPAELIGKLYNHGYKTIYHDISRDFAPFGTERPPILRIIGILYD